VRNVSGWLTRLMVPCMGFRSQAAVLRGFCWHSQGSSSPRQTRWCRCGWVSTLGRRSHLFGYGTKSTALQAPTRTAGSCSCGTQNQKVMVPCQSRPGGTHCRVSPSGIAVSTCPVSSSSTELYCGSRLCWVLDTESFWGPVWCASNTLEDICEF